MSSKEQRDRLIKKIFVSVKSVMMYISGSLSDVEGEDIPRAVAGRTNSKVCVRYDILRKG